MSIQRNHTGLANRAAFRLLVFALLLFSFAAAASAQEQANDIKVERVSFPVTLADGSPAEVAGYLYYKGSFHNRTLLLAVHGATYNHKYWDVPTINGHEYSFARYMAEQKYAVLAVDQLAAGESTRPEDGDSVTLDQTASALHQVIARLRSGENACGYAFERVVTVGHSLGAINVIYEQGTYHDADAIITTGAGHVPHPLPFPDAVIAEMLQHEYFPFPAEMRGPAFYYAPGADPDVIAYDINSLADLLSRGQLTTAILTSFDTSASRVGQVNGPVLVQMGEFDALFPTTYADGEAAFYTSASSVDVQALPGVGHDFNTHYRNHEGWKQMDAWLQSKGF
jgi:pimeloyl-ACP methyl ester carboxylesterase